MLFELSQQWQPKKNYYNAHNFVTRVSFTQVSVHKGDHDGVVKCSSFPKSYTANESRREWCADRHFVLYDTWMATFCLSMHLLLKIYINKSKNTKNVAKFKRREQGRIIT